MSEIEKPTDLTDIQSQVWDELVPEIVGLGWIDRIDRRLILQYVQVTALADRALGQLAHEDLTVLTSKGTSAANPLYRIYIDASRQAAALADRGVGTSTPTARRQGSCGRDAKVIQRFPGTVRKK